MPKVEAEAPMWSVCRIVTWGHPSPGDRWHLEALSGTQINRGILWLIFFLSVEETLIFYVCVRMFVTSSNMSEQNVFSKMFHLSWYLTWTKNPSYGNVQITSFIQKILIASRQLWTSESWPQVQILNSTETIFLYLILPWNSVESPGWRVKFPGFDSWFSINQLSVWSWMRDLTFQCLCFLYL